MAGGTIDGSYLRRMRMGEPPHAIITLGNGPDSFNVEVVLLMNDVMTEIREKTEERFAPNVEDGIIIKNPSDSEKNRANYYNRLLCYHCLRVPNNINEKISGSEDEISQLLDDEDIKRVCDKYNELIVNKAPKLEVLTEEQLDELKKFLGVTSLRDLSTVSLIHLKYCHQTLVSEGCLTSNGFGCS